MPWLDQYLKFLKDRDASDLHLAAGQVPHMRHHGEVQVVPNAEVLTDQRLREVLRELATPTQWGQYESNLDLDFSYAIPGVARFRVNYLNQEHGAGAVFRLIPEKIRTLDELRCPPAMSALADLESGLVLVTGPTGSGKSTTLAAIIDRINQKYAKHIITIEDPVEFVHPNKASTVSQREVKTDTHSFSAALRSAIRQDPGVILVGELRDMETIGLAITAAEMGVLVFGTLHTNSAAKTIDRLIDAFPTDQQGQVRTMLSESLAGIVSQLLLRTKDGRGRVAVHEILLKTPGLANVVREGNTPMINNIIQAGRGVGMQAMDDALYALAKSEVIDREEAFHKANDKKKFEDLLG